MQRDLIQHSCSIGEAEQPNFTTGNQKGKKTYELIVKNNKSWRSDYSAPCNNGYNYSQSRDTYDQQYSSGYGTANRYPLKVSDTWSCYNSCRGWSDGDYYNE